MTVQLLVNAVIGLALVGLIVLRQLRWRRVDVRRALRLPIVLAGLGVLQLSHLGAQPITTWDVALLTVELVVSVGIGAAMGRLTVFRRDPAEQHALQSRTGGAGAALWVVLIAVRLGLDAVGAQLGAHLLTATGAILLLVAASRATAALVAQARSAQGALRTGMIRA